MMQLMINSELSEVTIKPVIRLHSVVILHCLTVRSRSVLSLYVSGSGLGDFESLVCWHICLINYISRES